MGLAFDRGDEFEPPALRSIFLSQMSCQEALFLLREADGQNLCTSNCEKATSAPWSSTYKPIRPKERDNFAGSEVGCARDLPLTLNANVFPRASMLTVFFFLSPATREG